MSCFRTIIVAADFSDRSREAFAVACALAEEKKTRLFVLHVLEPEFSVDERGFPVPMPAPGTEQHQALLEQLWEAYAPHRPIDVQYRIAEGRAAEEILHTATELGADLIVLGTHGRTGVHRLLSGSVAESVLHRARISVLALHAPESAPVVANELRVILHPTDFSDQAQAALGVARALARDHGAQLVVLYVASIETLQGVALAMPRDPRIDAEPLKAIQAKTNGPDLKYPVLTRYEVGDAAAEIVGVAEELGCDLIVLGTHGRTGLGRFLMGSVAESVLRRAGCPTLIVKPIVSEPAAAVPAAPESRSALVF